MDSNCKITIEYLYLDLEVCDRCIGTDEVLDEVIKVLTPALRLAGYKEVVQQKIAMATPEIATQYRFISSPTIRVNGKDICLSVEENNCRCCSDIAGTNIECRIFRYKDTSYEIPPKEMLANAILQTLFSHTDDERVNDYTMPKNLKVFYQNKNIKGEFTMKKMSIFEPAMCCDTGLCGVSVDPELLRISTVFNALKKNGVAVDRFNLSSAPMAFVNNKVINAFINEKGVDGLPAVMVDEKIVITGRYPTNEELVSLLEVPESYLTEAKATQQGGCCCSDGNCC